MGDVGNANGPAGARRMRPELEPVGLGGLLVLVVEDDRTLAQTIELYLRNDGFRTERAFDGEQALTLFRGARPDLVLLDLGLPKLDGLEVLRVIRAASDVPVVILTGRSEEVDELLGLGLGAEDYLVKPVSARKLLARVKVVLRRVRPLRPTRSRCCGSDRWRWTRTGDARA